MKRVIYCFWIVLITFPVMAMPFRWRPLTSQPEDHIIAVRVDQNSLGTLMALSMMGKLYRSEDWGSSWVPIQMPNERYGVRYITAHPVFKNTWIASTSNDMSEGSIFWLSEDKGNSWNFLSEYPKETKYLIVSHHIPDLFLLVCKNANHTDDSLLRSVDGGLSWISLFDAPESDTPPFWHPTTPWQVYWSTYQSKTYGDTWENTSSKLLVGGGFTIPPPLFAADKTGLYYSLDDFKSWWPLLNTPSNFLCVNKNYPGQLLTGIINPQGNGEGSLYYSNNNGNSFASWSEGMPDYFSDVAIAADWLFFACRNGIIYTYDERPADLDGSERIDGGDLAILSSAFGAQLGDENYESDLDLNLDGSIDGNDLTILSQLWGHRLSYEATEPPGDFPSNLSH
ncbi:hypothetical protein JW979_02715 [bacterium]|nr:hypothetical protein [candidate division CSSED10-310 bacterium]